MDYLKINLDAINQKIVQACQRVGRSPEEITLIAVSKTVEADVMNASVEYGVQVFGENKVQEIRRKFPDVVSGPKWHLIGHLQSNKVKYIIDKVELIHSVDSFKLAEEINKRAGLENRLMDVLIQVDIAEETQKFGCDKDELYQLIKDILKLDHIRIKGLMFIAPFVDNPEEVRVYFKEMKQLFDQIKVEIKHDHLSMDTLSMGMTGDFEVAIEEGATMIRVGTGIFGKRNYS
ncbi:MAG: YggS family pyridoxal phosphate-dependent enzyme [Clostridia bacterium]|nr:YggS family pyridoxal phosphate-dependent enzyme [Clostridia bacterium]